MTILKSKHPSLVEPTITNCNAESSSVSNCDSTDKDNSVSDIKDDTISEKLNCVANESTIDTNPIINCIESKDEHTEDEQTEKSDSDDSMKKLRRKGVSFHSLGGNFKSEKKENTRPAPLLNRQEKVEISSSEDELQGYSTVIVSQNLTDEILSEIYGETGAENSTNNNKISSEDEHPYEDFSSKNESKVDSKLSKDDKSKLKPNFKIGDNITTVSSDQPHSSHSKIPTHLGSFEPKSLADEILDEVYGQCPGSKKKSVENNGEITSSEDEDGEYETIGEFRDEARKSNPNMTKNFKLNISNNNNNNGVVPKRGFSMNASGIGASSSTKSGDITNKPEPLHNPALIGEFYLNILIQFEIEIFHV